MPVDLTTACYHCARDLSEVIDKLPGGCVTHCPFCDERYPLGSCAE